MSVKHRSHRQGCPICAQQSQTSFPEQAIFFYFRQIFPDAINRYIFEKHEIDIFIPSKNIGVEYNGYFSHRGKGDKDIQKKEFFQSVGIHILLVKEYKCPEDMQNADYYIHERTTFEDLDKLIENLLLGLDVKISVDINTERDSILIKNQYIALRKRNSIAIIRPDLITRWDYEKNGSITPEMISLGSGQKFYWKCRICNRSYLASPSTIARGCACRRHRNILKPNENDLLTTHPELLRFWDYSKNDLDPSCVYGGGRIIIYWKCEKGHNYSRSIEAQLRSKGCPVCLGKKVLTGYNDLLSQNPELAKEWDYELNECLPSEIHHKSQNPNINWICSKCGYKWKHSVSNRNICPRCKKNRTKINVYSAVDLLYLGSFDNAKALCEYLGLNYRTQGGNIASVCDRRQKTLLGKYILRRASDDELIGKYNPEN